MQTSLRSLFFFVVILLLGTAARLHQIQSQSLWFDEGWSAYAAQQPTLVDAANADATNPPLYYVLLNLTTRFFGDSEFSLRLVSLFCGLLVIAISSRLAAQLFGGKVAPVAALLVAASPLLWWASQEARMYTLLAALVLVCALAWHRLLVRPSVVNWLMLWGGELVLLYAHNTGPVVALWLNCATVLAWAAARRLDRPLKWQWWIGGQMVVGLLWSPYFLTRYLNLAEANSAVASAPELTPEFGLHIWQAFWQTPWERVLLSGESPLINVGLLLLFLVLVAWKRPASRWLLLHSIILISGIVAALIVLQNEMHGRYLVMVAPLLLIPLGAGIARLKLPMLQIVLVAPFLSVFVLNLIYAQTSDYRHDDARTMVRYYADRLDSDDSVLAWSYADRYELAYYWDRLGVQARRVTLPEGADLDVVLPLLPRSGDVALNVWYTQRADYRGMMPCILGNGTINEPEQFTTYGMTNLLYRQPALNLPEFAPANLTFSDNATPIARVSAVGPIRSGTADRAQCIPVQVELLLDVEAELKAALIVQNQFGWEIARADAVFATADQRTGETVPTGTTMTAYPLLRLPYGAPAGEYRVFLRVYDEVNSPSGYLPPADQTLSGRDALLGVWNATSGAEWELVDRDAELPTHVNIPIRADLTLIAHDAALDGDLPVANGAEIRLTLLWRGLGNLPDITFADTEGTWRSVVAAQTTGHDIITREWRSVRVPAGAPFGIAELSLPDGTVIGRYRIESLPMLVEPLDYERAVGVTFPEIGELVGYSLSDPVSLERPPELSLIWRAGEMPSQVNYTVFAQLLNVDGRVIGQSDSLPASGARPATGWRAGEYIEDVHRLTYNDLAAPGQTTLIVGLYDASNNQRLRLADGTDYVVLGEVDIR